MYLNRFSVFQQYPPSGVVKTPYGLMRFYFKHDKYFCIDFRILSNESIVLNAVSSRFFSSFLRVFISCSVSFIWFYWNLGSLRDRRITFTLIWLIPRCYVELRLPTNAWYSPVCHIHAVHCPVIRLSKLSFLFLYFLSRLMERHVAQCVLFYFALLMLWYSISNVSVALASIVICSTVIVPFTLYTDTYIFAVRVSRIFNMLSSIRPSLNTIRMACIKPKMKLFSLHLDVVARRCFYTVYIIFFYTLVNLNKCFWNRFNAVDKQ